MADQEIDRDSVIKEGTAGDQKRMGTYKMHQHELQVHFRDLMQAGISDSRVLEKALEEFLSKFETIRVTQEREIQRLEQQISYCRARQRAASEHANLILAILTTHVSRAVQSANAADGKVPSSGAPTTPGIISDTEMLKTICICGCVDEDDASKCDCSCHSVGYCQDEKCAVCPDKRKSLSTVKPRLKKKVSRKKAVPKKGK